VVTKTIAEEDWRKPVLFAPFWKGFAYSVHAIFMFVHYFTTPIKPEPGFMSRLLSNVQT